MVYVLDRRFQVGVEGEEKQKKALAGLFFIGLQSGAAKPASVRHANAKPDATPKATDAKPAKPKAAAKHSTKPKSTEAKPADKTAAAPRT